MNELITILGGGSIIMAAIVYLSKAIISKAIDAGGNAYQLKLDKELETHRQELDLLKIQYQVKFSSLHEKRGEVISELYGLLYKLELDIQHYTSLGKGQEWITDDKFEIEAKKTYCDIEKLFETNRLFFSESICANIDSLLKERWEIISQMGKARLQAKLFGESIRVDLPEEKQPISIWMEQDRKAHEIINLSRIELAKEFRKLIDVENN